MVSVLIPARGGSKGIPNKNLKSLCGKPLIQWTIETAIRSPLVSEIFVSTDDPLIAEVSIECGASVPALRPKELATDESPVIQTVLHALDTLGNISDLLLLQPTSPIRSSTDITRIIELRDEYGSESAASVTLAHKHPAWMYSIGDNQKLTPLIPSVSSTRRQDLDPVYVLNGSMYLSTARFIRSNHALISSQTIGYAMPPERSFDIDTMYDWCIVESVLGRGSNE